MKTLAEYVAAREDLEVALAGERFNEYAGLDFDKDRMGALSEALEALAREALASFPPDEFPRPLLYVTIYSAHQAEYTRLRMELIRRRTQEVNVEVNGERVHLGNWRHFNYRYRHDPARRRQAFDALMDRAQTLTPILQSRFHLTREAFAAYNLTPLGVYLDEEQVSLEQLKSLIHECALYAKRTFLEEGDRYSREVLGKPMDYYDDFYVFRHAIHDPFDPLFGAADYTRELNTLYKSMGFDLNRILVDGEVREGKEASPACFAVRIPTDVRVVYRVTSPVADYTGYSHEMGHALHFSSIRPFLPYPARVLIPDGTAEVFSHLFEDLGLEPSILKRILGLDARTVEEIRRREGFMFLYFLTFYGVNAMFKLRFWEEGLSMEAADRLYERLCEEYMGFSLPGRYWQTHHVLSRYDIYAPSYLLAYIRTNELLTFLRQQFGFSWWEVPAATAFIRDQLMGPGREVPFSLFSHLNPRPMLQRYVDNRNAA